MAWHRRPVLRPVTQRILAAVGLAGLALMLGLWHVADRADESFYRGGLLAYAALTALVVVGAVQPVGPLRRVLALRPLVFVGTVSYGAYLFHWPILVWLQQHTGHPPWTRTAIGLALSIGLATASLQLLERPVRTGRWPATARAAPVGLGACALAVGAVVGLTPWRADTTTTTDFEAAANLLDELGEPPPVPDEAAAELSPDDWEALERWAARDRAIAESDAPRLAVFGDSTAVMTGYGLSHWMFDNLDTLAPAPGSATLGCGLLDDVVRRVGSAEAAPPPACDGWTGRWRAATEATTIDVALVQFGPWDVRPHQLEPGGPFLVVGEDPELDAALGRQLAEGVDVLLEEVPVVVLVASPDVTFGRVAGRDPGRASPDADPARMARFRALLDEVAASRDRVAVVDLHGHLAGRDDDRRLRPDGVHFTEATAEEVAGWLGPELARLHDRLRPDAPT
jgi:lysophospholipase L1-like esterase